MFLPFTTHFATRLASQYARPATLLPPSTHGCSIWTIGEVVVPMALLSGIPVSPELQDPYRQHSINCDPVSVLPVRTSGLFGEPSSSRFPCVRSACTILLHPSLAGTLSAPLDGTLLPLTTAGTTTAELLPRPGGSPSSHPLLRFTLQSQTSYYVTPCHGTGPPPWPMPKAEASPIPRAVRP